MRRFARQFAIAWVLGWAGAALAAPMGYQGSTMAMGDFSTNWRELSVNHAVTAKDALGADYTFMRSDDGSTTREIAEANYTRLLYRANLPTPRPTCGLSWGWARSAEPESPAKSLS